MLEREEFLERLRNLDEEARLFFFGSSKFQLVIVGSAALFLTGHIPKMTHDMEVLDNSMILRGLMPTYDIYNRLEQYMDILPNNYAQRLNKLDLGTDTIDFYITSLEDTIVTKMFSQAPEDYLDITRPEVIESIDWEVLNHLATSEEEAAKDEADNKMFIEFFRKYYEYERKYRP